MLKTVVSFVLQGTMTERVSLQQKEFMDLPEEIIEDWIMASLSVQDLCNLKYVGNRRLKDFSQNAIKKRPVSKYHLSIVFLINFLCNLKAKY